MGGEYADEAVYTLPGISLELSGDGKGQPANTTKLPTITWLQKQRRPHTGKSAEFCALIEKLMNSAERAFRFKGTVHQHNYSPSVAFEAITLHTMPATHCRRDPSEDNGWLSGIIGPDATNKLKCVSLSGGTVPRTVTDVAINAWEQPLWRLKKVIILPCQWAALP